VEVYCGSGGGAADVSGGGSWGPRWNWGRDGGPFSPPNGGESSILRDAPWSLPLQ
jgi:hypothetical protein